MKPYADQWVYLSSIERLDEEQVDALLAKLHTAPLGTLRSEDEEQNYKPWQRQQTEISPEDLPSSTEITLADRVYVPIQHFSDRAQNQLKRIAAFRNPQYYRNQAMRMPVWNVPRIACRSGMFRESYAAPSTKAIILHFLADVQKKYWIGCRQIMLTHASLTNAVPGKT